MTDLTRQQLANRLVIAYNDSQGRAVCIDGKTALAIVDVLRGTPVADNLARTCTLTEGPDGDYWESSCGHCTVWEDGPPSLHGYDYCGHCGARAIEVRWVEPPFDPEAEDVDALRGTPGCGRTVVVSGKDALAIVALLRGARS